MNIRERARLAAESTLEATWDTDRYPVDPFAIARNLGVEVSHWQIPEDVSGMLRKLPGKSAEIYIDVDDHPRRRRFTCAHELGHLLERSENGEIPDAVAFVDRRGQVATLGSDPHEIFANEFAANLLMPEAAVRALSGMGLTALARFFDVSVIAMENRLKNLGLFR